MKKNNITNCLDNVKYLFKCVDYKYNIQYYFCSLNEFISNSKSSFFSRVYIFSLDKLKYKRIV